jgi:hypothetical protein
MMREKYFFLLEIALKIPFLWTNFRGGREQLMEL